LDTLLSLFAHFLFPITVPLPTHAVYHSTHHGLQTILGKLFCLIECIFANVPIGVIASNIYGSSLLIWDHGMLWREKIKVI
jgi:hypothetical protein